MKPSWKLFIKDMANCKNLRLIFLGTKNRQSVLIFRSKIVKGIKYKNVLSNLEIKIFFISFFNTKM